MLTRPTRPVPTRRRCQPVRCTWDRPYHGRPRTCRKWNLGLASDLARREKLFFGCGIFSAASESSTWCVGPARVVMRPKQGHAASGALKNKVTNTGDAGSVVNERGSTQEMDGLWDFLSRQLASNQFFSGGLILMVSGAALAL